MLRDEHGLLLYHGSARHLSVSLVRGVSQEMTWAATTLCHRLTSVGVYNEGVCHEMSICCYSLMASQDFSWF